MQILVPATLERRILKSRFKNVQYRHDLTSMSTYTTWSCCNKVLQDAVGTARYYVVESTRRMYDGPGCLQAWLIDDAHDHRIDDDGSRSSISWWVWLAMHHGRQVFFWPVLALPAGFLTGEQAGNYAMEINHSAGRGLWRHATKSKTIETSSRKL